MRGNLVDEATKVVALGKGLSIEHTAGQILDVDAGEGVGRASVAMTYLVNEDTMPARD